MTDTLPFNDQNTWPQQVLSADAIWKQVKQHLMDAGKECPKTPRLDDVRLILNNVSGETLQFLNPGNHTVEQAETIPHDGEKTAVMVMLEGDTVDQQMKNAGTLVEKFNLDVKGLSREFAHALGGDETTGLVKEAYGPAPYLGQTERLVDVTWEDANGREETVSPVSAQHCAYGMRAPEQETVFMNEVALFVRGTGTVSERVEGVGMCIAVSSDWETGKETTRPIVPSIARGFYGAHFDSMPTVVIDPIGNVQCIDLGNGDLLNISPPASNAGVLPVVSRNNIV
jgi:hypothetical protein